MDAKLRSGLIFALCCWGCLEADGLQGNYYADENRELFLSPKSAALAGADAALGRSILPMGNPATLCNDSMRELSLAYAGYFQNSFSTSSLSYIGPTDNHGAFGIAVSYLLVPNIELYSVPDSTSPVNTSTANASDLFLRVGYSRVLVDLGKGVSLAAGAAVNAERRNLIDYTGYGIGVDGGLNFLLNFKEIASTAAAGLIVENLTTTYIRWSADYKEFAYPHLRLGLGWQKDLPYVYGRGSINYLSPDLLSKEGVNAQADASDSSGSIMQVPVIKSIMSNPTLLLLAGRGGAEYTIMDVVTVRAGLTRGNWSFGGGLHLLHNRAGIDFAYLSHDLAPTYKLSLNYRWY